jgi:hypothetical protein
MGQRYAFERGKTASVFETVKTDGIVPKKNSLPLFLSIKICVLMNTGDTKSELQYTDLQTMSRNRDQASKTSMNLNFGMIPRNISITEFFRNLIPILTFFEY